MTKQCSQYSETEEKFYIEIFIHYLTHNSRRTITTLDSVGV